MISDRLFVYGTLMRGFDHPMAKLLSRSAEFLGEARCQGRLHLVKHYPGLVLSDDPGEVVFGELYRLCAPKQLLREFDMYEACGEGFAEPAEYIRQILTVTCDDGAVSEAWTYIYNWPVADLPRIASGRFLGKYTPMLRKLASTETDAAALVHRTAFDDALPALAGLHTPAEDRWFFRERVFEACELWGAFDRAALLGIIAFRAGWIDHLYVLPIAQGHGVGTQLLQVAQSSFGDLQLWTFQCNLRARRFYETRGFVLAEETDGARNEEREPDARYRWRRPE